MLDSTDDMYICKDQVSFDSLQKKEDFGYIHDVSNSKLKIEDVGRVRLKLYNGVVKRLADVKFVPSARANIISLCELTSLEYKYDDDREFCKIFKGDSLVLQKKEERKEYLFFGWMFPYQWRR